MHELLNRNHLSPTNSSDWLFLSVVRCVKVSFISVTIFCCRDPIDRFLSGYADKCIKFVLPISSYTFKMFREEKRKTSPTRCYGCARNLTCFVERLYSRAMRYGSGDSRSRSVFQSVCKYTVKFTENFKPELKGEFN
jgi:hypothetical protein